MTTTDPTENRAPVHTVPDAALIDAVSQYLRVRDENVAPEFPDDLERYETATEIAALVMSRLSQSTEAGPATAQEGETGGWLAVQNPIEELRLAALDAFPDLRCRVVFAAAFDDGHFGETFFPDDGTDPLVQVAVGIPMEAVIEVMAHELAHVAAGLAADHGLEWEAAFSAIHAAYVARMELPVSPPDREGERR